ncbi:hypothetical protein ACH5RR_036080, partial [Cinchona calisaya]
SGRMSGAQTSPLGSAASAIGGNSPTSNSATLGSNKALGDPLKKGPICNKPRYENCLRKPPCGFNKRRCSPPSP